MRQIVARIVGTTPMSHSRLHETERLDRETWEDYEKRTWREKAHVTDEGFVFIPPMSLKQALVAASRMLGEQIPGKGKSTYTKHFEAGVTCTRPVVLSTRKDQLTAETIFANADGKRGSGKRVKRTFPMIPAGWSADVHFTVLDDIITLPVFEKHLAAAGALIGIGRFRQEKGGFLGAFQVHRCIEAEKPGEMPKAA